MYIILLRNFVPLIICRLFSNFFSLSPHTKTDLKVFCENYYDQICTQIYIKNLHQKFI